MKKLYCKDIVLKPGTYLEVRNDKNIEGISFKDLIRSVLAECDLVDVDCKDCKKKVAEELGCESTYTGSIVVEQVGCEIEVTTSGFPTDAFPITLVDSDLSNPEILINGTFTLDVCTTDLNGVGANTPIVFNDACGNAVEVSSYSYNTDCC